MPRSPLALAALATVAVPGLDAFDVRAALHTGGEVDAAVVLDAQGRHWVVRAPRSAAAGAALEAEVALLGGLLAHVRDGRLPFDVPRPVGFAPLPEGGRAVVHPHLPGRPLRLEDLGPGPGLAAEVGRALAALHELPTSTVEDAGLPVYEAEAYRLRRLSEVDEAARTGRVPAALLRRWERALEDVGVWRFRPTVVHGDLSSEHVLCVGPRPTAVLGWNDAKVADPADDLAWLLVAAPQEAVDPILESYNLHRTELRDRHLADRALLAGELALARWLLHGVRVDDAEIVDDATAMLVELDEYTSAVDAPPPSVPGWSSAAPQSAPAPTDDGRGPDDSTGTGDTEHVEHVDAELLEVRDADGVPVDLPAQDAGTTDAAATDDPYGTTTDADGAGDRIEDGPADSIRAGHVAAGDEPSDPVRYPGDAKPAAAEPVEESEPGEDAQPGDDAAATDRSSDHH